jgi:hypothetical protein
MLGFAVWLDEDKSHVHKDKDSLDLYTEGSFRICAAFGWTLRDSSDQEIDNLIVVTGPSLQRIRWGYSRN